MSSENVILFYDIPSSLPGCAWSPNTWKTRYALNYKGLTYRTVWVDLLDIPTEAKKMGATPTRVDLNGIPVYTLPMIHDPSTGITVSDSLRIAEYLDAMYPDTPRLIPEGTQALHHAFVEALTSTLAPTRPLTFLKALTVFSPVTQVRFRRIREDIFGKPLEEIFPTAEAWEAGWNRMKNLFEVVDGWIKAGGSERLFVMGDTITFADFAIAAWCRWFKVLWGEHSKEWQRIRSWHGGRWDILLKRLEKFDVIL